MRKIFKRGLGLPLLILFCHPVVALDALRVIGPVASGMTQQRLHDLILSVGDDVIIADNIVRFTIAGAPMLCVSDIRADRMRLVSPVANLEDIDNEQLLLAMAANYHTVLDARYAIGDGVVYAAFIHPLSPLTDEELFSAISQVATASATFGTEYSSGALVFPGASAN